MPKEISLLKFFELNNIVSQIMNIQTFFDVFNPKSSRISSLIFFCKNSHNFLSVKHIFLHK